MTNKISGDILGIFWTTASWVDSEDSISVKNMDKNKVETVQKFIADYYQKYKIYKTVEEKRGDNYTFYNLKIYNTELIKLLRKNYLWKGRKEYTRYYPDNIDESQDIDFLKYYVENKSSLDKDGSRLRVFANWNFINMISEKLHDMVGVKVKTPVSHSNSDKMQILNYQDKKEIAIILDFLGYDFKENGYKLCKNCSKMYPVDDIEDGLCSVCHYREYEAYTPNIWKKEYAQYTKTCGGCNQEFPATPEYFIKNKNGKYGLGSKCPKCRRKYRENLEGWKEEYADRTKECTLCGEEFAATPENFYKDSRGKYGLMARCKDCHNK